MNIYNFDEVIDRKGSGAIKTDALKERFGHADLIPMWVADMDFRTGDFIVDALKKRCEHEIFGYTMPREGYFNSIRNWILSRHHWEIEQKWFSYIPGIVKGIGFCVMNFTRPGDKIIIQPPVYHPFRIIPEMHHRTVVYNPLIETDGTYRMDLKGLRQLIDEDCKLLILSNPHNPVGIAWDRETMTELAEICYQHNVLVISDEIHADMTLFGNRHIPFATVSEKARENSITFMAPSKTFNIAGIVSSYAIVPNDKIRDDFFHFLHASELNEASIFAYEATLAAYENGTEWLQQMLAYLEKNILFVEHFLQENIPDIRAFRPEASFLIWLDCRKLGLPQKELTDLFIRKAGLALNDGEIFGQEGQGFMRMNIGCPCSIIEKALNNLKKAITEGI